MAYKFIFKIAARFPDLEGMIPLKIGYIRFYIILYTMIIFSLLDFRLPPIETGGLCGRCRNKKDSWNRTVCAYLLLRDIKYWKPIKNAKVQHKILLCHWAFQIVHWSMVQLLWNKVSVKSTLHIENLDLINW